VIAKTRIMLTIKAISAISIIDSETEKPLNSIDLSEDTPKLYHINCIEYTSPRAEI
jgi:hypothetical protein